MSFSLNGKICQEATMWFDVTAREADTMFFPAASTDRSITFNIPRETWQFPPSDASYAAWLDSGVFVRPAVTDALPRSDKTAEVLLASGETLYNATWPNSGVIKASDL